MSVPWPGVVCVGVTSVGLASDEMLFPGLGNAGPVVLSSGFGGVGPRFDEGPGAVVVAAAFGLTCEQLLVVTSDS